MKLMDRREELSIDEGSFFKRLRELLAGDASSSFRFENVERIGHGRSKANWKFDVVDARTASSGVRPMIARRAEPGGLLETDLVIEYRLLKRLQSTDLPVPRPKWIDENGDRLGQPTMIMERLPGKCHYYLLNDPERSLEARLDLARQLLDVLARIHDVNWKGLGLDAVLTVPTVRPSIAALDQWDGALARNQIEAYPELTLISAWLRATAPCSEELALVHGDFKPGNVLVEGGEVCGVLDWETAHIGDPLEDVGWMLQPLRTREQQIPELWEKEHIVGAYEATRGNSIDDGHLQWWTVFACYKAACIQITGIARFLEGQTNQTFSEPLPAIRAGFDLLEEMGIPCIRP